MRILFFANTDWYLFNFRLALLEEARRVGHEVVLVSPTGPFVSRLIKQGFAWTELDMDRRSINPLRELQVLRRLTDIYRGESPDICHHFTIKCVIYGGLAARSVGIQRHVNAVAGLGYVFSSDSRYARMLRPIVRSAIRFSARGSHFILQNADDVAELLEQGIATPEKVHLIPGSGVDTERFQPRPVQGEPARPLRVLLATRLLWEKGVEEYRRAAAEIGSEFAEVEFLLAGSPDPGNPASVPIALVESWDRAGTVTYLGHVEDMAQLLRGVDIVVLPSRYREGVPRILIEAAASGLPVVTTSTPGCRDIVEDGENGFLVEPADVPGLTRAIRRLLLEPGLRDRMGKAGRLKALQQFDERLVIGETMKVYEQMVS
jgi:glycosyltransferase involved in cell wall biosynthesis